MSKNSEALIQSAILEYVRTVSPEVLIWHTPNGGLRNKREAARLKWQGVKAGVLDLCLCWWPGQIAFIEVKQPGKGLTKEQKEFAARLTALGIKWWVARSIDDARAALDYFLIDRREAND